MEIPMNTNKFQMLSYALEKAEARISSLESHVKELASINDAQIQSVKELFGLFKMTTERQASIINDLTTIAKNHEDRLTILAQYLKNINEALRLTPKE